MSAPPRTPPRAAALAAAVVAAIVSHVLSPATRRAAAVWVASGWAGLRLSPTLIIAALCAPDEEQPTATLAELKRHGIAAAPAPKNAAPGSSLHAAITGEHATTELPAEVLAAWLDSLPPVVAWGVLPHDARHLVSVTDLRALLVAPLRGSLHLARAALHGADGRMEPVTRITGEGWAVLLRVQSREGVQAIALDPATPHALVCSRCAQSPGADASESARDARARARRWRHEDSDAGRLFVCRACVESAP